MTYIFNTFEDIYDQTLNKERQKFINHTYVHSGSITNVFNVISKYTATEDAHGTPKIDDK